jgi:hypothetical protein
MNDKALMLLHHVPRAHQEPVRLAKHLVQVIQHKTRTLVYLPPPRGPVFFVEHAAPLCAPSLETEQGLEALLAGGCAVFRCHGRVFRVILAHAGPCVTHL